MPHGSCADPLGPLDSEPTLPATGPNLPCILPNRSCTRQNLSCTTTLADLHCNIPAKPSLVFCSRPFEMLRRFWPRRWPLQVQGHERRERACSEAGPAAWSCWESSSTDEILDGLWRLSYALHGLGKGWGKGGGSECTPNHSICLVGSRSRNCACRL